MVEKLNEKHEKLIGVKTYGNVTNSIRKIEWMHKQNLKAF
jgi:hypothetical protein